MCGYSVPMCQPLPLPSASGDDSFQLAILAGEQQANDSSPMVNACHSSPFCCTILARVAEGRNSEQEPPDDVCCFSALLERAGPFVLCGVMTARDLFQALLRCGLHL